MLNQYRETQETPKISSTPRQIKLKWLQGSPYYTAETEKLFAVIGPFPLMASETWTSAHLDYSATLPKITRVDTTITTVVMIMTMLED